MSDTGRDHGTAASFWTQPFEMMGAANVYAVWERMFKLAAGSAEALGHAQQANLAATMCGLELMTSTYARMWGQAAKEVLPADERFVDEAWNDNIAFATMKQAYLITAQWLVDLADGLKDVDPALHQRVVFYARTFADALSPTNFALTNPTVLQEAIRTGGANLLEGTKNLMADMQAGRVSQVPQGSFEVGKDLALTPGQVVYRNQLIELIQYTPTTKRVHAVPILVTAPWINKYYVMDLRPDNSMFRHLVDAGFTLFAISWKNADSSMRHLDWEDYMEQGTLQALHVVKSITGAKRVNMVGYCLGALLTETTLAYLAAVGDATPNTATFFTMHQDFSDVGDIAAFISHPEVQLLEWLMSASGGYLDGRNMAATFSMLRGNDLLWRYVVNNYLLGKQPAAFDLLYWNSDSTRVPQAIHSFLLHKFFLEDKLVKPGAIELKGVGIDLGKITLPVYTVGTRYDHIVPWKGAFKICELVGGPVRFILADSGHIAGIINPPASHKRSYWHWDEAGGETDPDRWLEHAQKEQGSWWVDWIPWLQKQSGRKVAPPPPSGGNAEFPPIVAAPGTYVLEK